MKKIVYVMAVLLVGVAFLGGCHSDEETDWTTLYANDNTEFERRLSEEAMLDKQNILLSVLSNMPEAADSICPKLTNSTAQQTCKRYQQRPHLQSISPAEQPIWSGGDLGERTVFPREFIPLESEYTSDIVQRLDASCLESSICLQMKAEEHVLINWQHGAVLCQAMAGTLSQSDCLFHIAESLPVHVERYESAAKLCSLSGGFSGECHNHVLLKYATKMYDRVDWHQQLINKFTSLYSPEYAERLSSVYWSIVAFRVVGMEYPLDTARFLDWPAEFLPHLRSIVALRMWEEEDAWQKSKRALKGEMMRVAKARGPNAPRFTPTEKWSNRDEKMQWIRFCDLRGGHRPVHINPEIDLAWALLTAFSMSDEFQEARWLEVYNGIGKEHWEVRWAMARLLSDIDKSSPLYTKLKQDTDSRVLQALY